MLSLADLRGLADLAEGEGLTFDVLEIDMEKTKDLLTLKEILALGPSMSVLMEGYQRKRINKFERNIVPKNFKQIDIKNTCDRKYYNSQRNW